MDNLSNYVQLLPIPWMKQKLENLYDMNLYGNLYIMFKDFKHYNHETIESYILEILLEKNNICIDDQHILYLYLPSNINNFLKNLILSFKQLFKDNVKIIIVDYKENHPAITKLDFIVNTYTRYPELKDLIDDSYLIDNSKCYEIFTSLSDTQRILIEPPSACTISGLTFNCHIKNSNPNNTYHISFVSLLNDYLYSNFVDYYIKGLTNNNNNFNFNF